MASRRNRTKSIIDEIAQLHAQQLASARQAKEHGLTHAEAELAYDKRFNRIASLMRELGMQASLRK